MPYSGDDLAHMVTMGEYFETHPVWRYPFFFVGHWLDTNGRLADKINPILFLTLPHWINALIAALSIPSMMWIVFKHCRFNSNHITASVVALSVMVFALPWWDSMQAYVCIYNYIIATLLPLLFLYILQRQKDKTSPHWLMRWGCYLFSLIAGMMHEAIGVPLACGLIAYQIMAGAWKGLAKVQRGMVVSFMCGVAWGFFAPSLWSRLGQNTTPDDPLFILLLKSDSIALLLLVVIAIGMCFAKTRKLIMEAARTPWVIFAVAAIASMCFSAMSGIVGRSGWFAQVFAIIAIFRWITDHNYKINRKLGATITTILITLIVVHYVGFARYQVKVGEEFDDVVSLYQKSTDGVVLYDVTPDNEIPWWVLNKTRGVPDADDLYLKSAFAQFYKTDNPQWLKVIPTDFQRVDATAIADLKKIILSNGNIVTTEKPDGKVCVSERENISIMLVEINGKEWVSTPFMISGCDKELYHLSPRVVDPGDRLR